MCIIKGKVPSSVGESFDIAWAGKQQPEKYGSEWPECGIRGSPRIRRKPRSGLIGERVPGEGQKLKNNGWWKLNYQQNERLENRARY